MNPACKAPIGVFDSGVGGLTILESLRHQLPNESFIYVADSAYTPYGEKSVNTIQERSLAISNYLFSQGCKVIVIACNTATTEAIQAVRSHVDIPIIGVEPAIKPAAEFSKTCNISVLATERTIASKRMRTLVEDHAQHCKVNLQPCPGLVDIIEGVSQEPVQPLLRKFLEPTLSSDVDALVLGCTHYPFLTDSIRSIIGCEVKIFDTGNPVARQLQTVLIKHGLLNDLDAEKPSIQIVSTGEETQQREIINHLWKYPATLSTLTPDLQHD